MMNDDVTVVSGSPPTRTACSDLMLKKLRDRWELASILHFIHVFESVMKTNLKLSAEEIETGLIEPNDSLFQLHIALLKGIVPRSKLLNGSDAWVNVLCKKLTEWWPWVAEGDFPLTLVKGEELSNYKNVDPITRMLLLKALCEVRSNEDDIVSYINDVIKESDGFSIVRKEKFATDDNGTSYWYDGSEITGHRLYKEVCKSLTKGKKVIPEISSQWEVIATNLEEFRKVVEEYSKSKVKLEVTVSKALEAEAIPALEKLEKKKHAALKQKRKRDTMFNCVQTSRTRSSRNTKPINYRYDQYDREIEEAIKITQNRKPAKVLKREKVFDSDFESTESESDMDKNLEGDDLKENVENEDKDKDKEEENYVITSKIVYDDNVIEENGGSRENSVPENVNINSKNRLTINSAVESSVVPDSEDAKLSEELDKRID